MAKFQPKNVLVTGGAGFIGTNFIYRLLQENVSNIINLDKLTYAGNLKNLIRVSKNDKYKFIQGDIGDRNLVLEIMQNYNIDTIVHFAAESHVDRSIRSPDEFISTNILGTYQLLEAARQTWVNKPAAQHRFHHISTDEVYGSLTAKAPAFTETTAYHPRSPYSASKAASDHLVHAYYHTYGLPITLSNCSNNYGPYQHPEKFIPTIIHACLTSQTIPIYGSGKNIRDWLYVTDHCNALIKILAEGNVGENYNIGGNNEWDNLSLAELVCAQMDKLYPGPSSYKNLINFVPDRLGHDFRYAINNHKIHNGLGWTPDITMQEGIAKTIEFYVASM